MHHSALLAGKIPACPNTLSRLTHELLAAIRDVLEDPRGYLAAVRFDGLPGNSRKARLRLGLAVGLLVYAVVFAGMLVAWMATRSNNHLSQQESRLITVLRIPPFLPRTLAQGEDPKTSSGGGGGGRNTESASAGQFPEWNLTPAVIAPRPETPNNPPSLPVMERLLADPRFQPRRDELAPTGLPGGVPGPPLAGPGSEGGIGIGTRGGVGNGDGPGAGEGEGGNFNRGTYGIGDPHGRRISQPAVDARPVLLNNPRPFYTEEARVRKVQGVVQVRLLVGADGRVKEVVVKSGLPHGLTEQAILAAHQMRFTPATKGGVAVSYWLGNVVIEFNIR